MSRSDGDTLVLPMPVDSISTNSTSDLESLSTTITQGDSIRSARSLSILRDLEASETMPRTEEMTINLCSESISDLESLFPSNKSTSGSLRSVKSLSVFKNSEAPQSMRRSEEVTISLYEHDPSNPGSSGVVHHKKQRRGNETAKSKIESVRKRAVKDSLLESSEDKLGVMKDEHGEGDLLTGESSKRVKQDSSSNKSAGVNGGEAGIEGDHESAEIRKQSYLSTRQVFSAAAQSNQSADETTSASRDMTGANQSLGLALSNTEEGISSSGSSSAIKTTAVSPTSNAVLTANADDEINMSWTGPKNTSQYDAKSDDLNRSELDVVNSRQLSSSPLLETARGEPVSIEWATGARAGDTSQSATAEDDFADLLEAIMQSDDENEAKLTSQNETTNYSAGGSASRRGRDDEADRNNGSNFDSFDGGSDLPTKFTSQMQPRSTHAVQRTPSGASATTVPDRTAVYSDFSSTETMPLNYNEQDNENIAPSVRTMKTRGNHTIQRINNAGSSAPLSDSFAPDTALRTTHTSTDTLLSAESADENDTNGANVRTHMKPRSSHLIQRNYSSASSNTFNDTARRAPDIDYRLGRAHSPADDIDDTTVVRTHMKPRSAHTIQRVLSGSSSADFAASGDSLIFSEQLSPSLQQSRPPRRYSPTFSNGTYTEDELNDRGRRYSPVAGRPSFRRSTTPQSVSHHRSGSRPLLIEIEPRQQRSSSRGRNIDDTEVPVTMNHTRSAPNTTNSARRTPLTVDVRLPDDRDLSDDGSTIITQSRDNPSERRPSRPLSSSARRTPLTVEVQLPQKPRSYGHHSSSRSMPDLADIEMLEDFETFQNIPVTRSNRKSNQNMANRRRRDPDVYLKADVENVDKATRRRPHSSIGTQDLSSARRYRPRSTTGSSRRAHISGIGVEDRRHRGRRSWRTDDMPSTDIEDLYDYDQDDDDDDDDDRVTSRRRPRKHVAHIYIGDDDGGKQRHNYNYPTNTLSSVFSEPVTRPKSSMSTTQQPVVEYRKSVVSVSNSNPISYRTSQSPLKFQHMDTQVSLMTSERPMSPDSSIAAIDPELRDARKSGTNYNITLTLKPLMTTPSATGTVAGSVFDQSFNHNVTMTTSKDTPSVNGSFQPFVSQTPVLYTQHQQPHDRDIRRTHQYTDVILTDRSPRSLLSPSIVQVGSRPQSSAVRPSGSQIGFDIEVESLSGSDVEENVVLPAQRSSPRHRPTSNRKPQFEIPLLSSIDINYNPEEDDNKAWRRTNGKPIPAVKRQPKMVDVPIPYDDDDDEDSFDGPLIDDVEENANMFDRHYFENKENPLYSSDPDLSQVVEQPVSAARTIPKTMAENSSDYDDDFEVVPTREAPLRAERRPKPIDDQSDKEVTETWTTYHTVPIVNGAAVNQRVAGGKSMSAVEKSQELSDSALYVQQMYEQGDFDQEISVSHGYDAALNKSRNLRNQRMISQRQGTMSRSDGSETLTVSEMIQTIDVRSLLQGATFNSVRQTIDVERLEDEILSERPTPSTKKTLDTSLDVDYDTVSEQVDMVVTDNGMAITTSRVRCERAVPIRGSDDMFKKSSVLVTKRIEVDLMVTPARQRLWKLIKGVHTTVSADDQTSIVEQPKGGLLNKSDTFALYNKFLSLAEMTKAMNKSSS